jgi:hypothetical protein
MNDKNKFSAGEQGLGYIYQPRFALLKMLQLPESTAVLIEKDDDLDFIDADGKKSLGSLKHKAEGERLADLGVDFWKSVRVWLAAYKREGRITSNLKFFLFTTATISETSFLGHFRPGAPALPANQSLLKLAEDALAETTSALILGIAKEFGELPENERTDFLSRISIFESSPRIEDLPPLIMDLMRVVKRENRQAVFERLEGWWNDLTIKLLTRERDTAITGFEVSDKLAAINSEYQEDNLPITFRKAEPVGGVLVDTDSRMFVRQLREIGIGSARIRNAILDYYRAFEQRSSWARESLLISDEIEDYEERLVDEWSRYKDVVFETLDETTAEDLLQEAGRELYRWADLESGNIASLRIRERVSEPYVIRGGFHILANFMPKPKVWWHPRFLDRLDDALGVKR